MSVNWNITPPSPLHGNHGDFAALDVCAAEGPEKRGALRLYQFRRLAEPFAAPLAEIPLKPGEFIAMRAFAGVNILSGYFGVHEIELLWPGECLMVFDSGSVNLIYS